MMRNKKRWMIIPVILIGVLIGFLLFRKFVNSETAYMNDICEVQLATFANENASGIKGELVNALEYVNLVAARFEDDDITLSDDAAGQLRVLKNSTIFSRIFLSDLNGNCISDSGAMYSLADREFYRRAMFGESSIRLAQSSDGQDNILISTPVLTDGKVIGAIHGELDLYTLYKIMNINSFDNQGYATLVNTSGDYVISSSNEHVLNTHQENFFSWLNRAAQLDAMTANDLKAQMESYQTGIFSLTVGNNYRVVCFIPIGINDWYLIQQVTGDYVASLVAGTNRNVLVFVIELCSWISLCILGVVLYINKQRQAQQAAAKRFIALSNNIPGGVAEIEIGDNYLVRYANDGFYALTGYSKDEFESTTHGGRDLILSPGGGEPSILHTARSQIAAGDTLSLEYRIEKKGGEIRWLHTAGTVISRKQDIAVLQAIITDITSQKEQTALVIDRAKHDKMTQLYDKVSVGELINQVLTDTGKENTNVVIVLDIDNFKHINDTYGHQIGDLAIIAVADRLKESFRNTDIIGRIGGDEFTVCMCHVPDSDFVKSKLETLLESFHSIVVAGIPNLISCSAGSVVVQPFVNTNYTHVFQAADKNLYQIKKTCKGHLKISEMYLDSAFQETEEANV